MNKFLTTVVASIVAVSTMAEGNAWRVSVGGRARFGIDSSLHLNGRAGYALTSTQENTFQNKLTLAQGDANGLHTFDNGTYNPHDETNNGETTCYWDITDPKGQTGSQVLFSSEYVKVQDSDLGALVGGAEDEETYGASVDVSYMLWRNDRCGVDVSLGFSWFDDVNILKSSGSIFSRTIETGLIQSTANLTDGTVETIPNLGCGTPEGPGPLLDVPSFTEPSVRPESSKTTSLWLHANGKMSMLEAQLAAQPWVRVWDNLYLRGKVGVAMIATDISINGSAYESGRGTIWSGSEDTDDLTFAAVLGLSAEYYFTDNFFISGGVEYLLGAEDTDIDSDFVQGSVGVGDFGATLALGWAF